MNVEQKEFLYPKLHMLPGTPEEIHSYITTREQRTSGGLSWETASMYELWRLQFDLPENITVDNVSEVLNG